MSINRWAYVYKSLVNYGFDITIKQAYATALAILEEAERHDSSGTRDWERTKSGFHLENNRALQIHEREAFLRTRLIYPRNRGRPFAWYGHYGDSLSHAGLFHTARAYMEKDIEHLKQILVQYLPAGSGTQEEILEMLSYLVGMGDDIALLKKADLLYMMDRSVEAEELIIEIDAVWARGWSESIVSLLGAAYLGEPLSASMLEFIRNNQQLQLPVATLLISAGYIDEGLEILERRVVDESKLPFTDIRELTSAIWREDVKQEMMANQRFLNILDSIGVGEDWKQEHARRAMSLTAITGIEVDPRDLE